MELIILILVVMLAWLIIAAVCIFIFKLGQSWSKVKKGKKPMGWRFHKILCELGTLVQLNIHSYWGYKIYCYHLNVMIKKYRINLYGDKF